MTNLLLKEFSHQDLDWMLAAGQHHTIEAGTLLLHPDRPSDTLYVLLQGDLAVSQAGQEMFRLAIGELVGALSGLDDLSLAIVSATTTCLVLAIPRSHLVEKLAHDSSFAAHFYRVSALLLTQRLEQLSRHSPQNLEILSQSQKQALTVFAELQDGDLDWLIAVGRVQKLAANTVLVYSDRPLDALHILLDGALAISMPEASHNPLVNALSDRAHCPSESEKVRLSRGDLLGEMLFVDACPAVTVTALRESQILSVPRWRLATKLLHDVNFAARFYRVLTALLAYQQQAIVQQMVNNVEPRSVHHSSLTDLSSQLMARLALAEARFEWMLKRIQIQPVGREIQW